MSLFKFAVASMGWLSLLAAGPARAIYLGPWMHPTSIVEEYFNVHTGHYFYALPSDDSEAIAAGRAGPGWVKTGLGFHAYPSLESANPSAYLRPGCETHPSPCVVVSRFYAPSPNSHFFTGDVEEAGILRRPGSGWIYEKTAFVLPLPDAVTGQCGAGLSPVYRLYNNRWMLNDSNHRFAPSEVARDRMIAQGWRYEGIAFCAYAISKPAVETRELRWTNPAAVSTRAACEESPAEAGACVAVANVPVPSARYAASEPSSQVDPFNARTGMFRWGANGIQHVIGLPAFSREAAASDVFTQLGGLGYAFGVYLTTRSRGPSAWSSMAVLQAPGGEPLFPWRPWYSTDYELELRYGLGLQRVVAASGGHAYGFASMVFVDSTSRLAIRLHVLAYGTLPAVDGARLDRDGGVTVGTSYGPTTPFGRSLETPTVATSAGFYNEQWLQPILYFQYRIDRPAFTRILAAARALQPGLSAAPDDYFVRRVGINNEVYGDGEIGMHVGTAAVRLYPR